MEEWEIASGYLIRKRDILEKIAAKTETQRRFIHKGEMRGLGRVLRERDALIDELVAINIELAREQAWKEVQGLRPMIQDIINREQAIIERSKQVLQEAIAEKARIAAELRNRKVQQQVKNQYINPWAVVGRGSRINERG